MASENCLFTGQVLSVRGSSISVNHGWSAGAHIAKDHALWTLAELADQLADLELEDPFDRLAVALGGALGVENRAQFEAMINSELDKA